MLVHGLHSIFSGNVSTAWSWSCTHSDERLCFINGEEFIGLLCDYEFRLSWRTLLHQEPTWPVGGQLCWQLPDRSTPCLRAQDTEVGERPKAEIALTTHRSSELGHSLLTRQLTVDLAYIHRHTVRGSFPGSKAAGAWSWPLTSI